MSPLYEYRCDSGHETTKLRKFDERDEPMFCDECGQSMLRFWSAHHTLPDGVYSYAPNIGSADAFDRKQAKMDKMREHRRDTGKTKLVDEV